MGRRKLEASEKRRIAVQFLVTEKEAERLDARGRELSPVVKVTRAEVVRAVLREAGVLEAERRLGVAEREPVEEV